MVKARNESGFADMRRILIADSSEEFRVALSEALADLYEISTCDSGNQVLEQMRFFQPDILVLDLMLPYIDGLTILQTASATGSLPVVLALTRLVNDYVQTTLTELGVEYLMVKPCSLKAMVSRIRDLDNYKIQPADKRGNHDYAPEELLLRLGLRAKSHGFAAAAAALIELRKKPRQMITKELYPAVAAKCDMNTNQVEHNIRGAIFEAWKCRDKELWGQYFPENRKTKLKPPSNGIFLTTLAAYIKIKEEK